MQCKEKIVNIEFKRKGVNNWNVNKAIKENEWLEKYIDQGPILNMNF